MQIKSLLTPERTCSSLEASSKKRALELLAQIIAQDIPGIDADDLLRRFLARERLGSTGVGHGIAIPHCRINSTDNNAIGALITLKHPVEFDSIDAEPVDILFAMLVPEDSHVERFNRHIRQWQCTRINTDSRHFGYLSYRRYFRGFGAKQSAVKTQGFQINL